MVGTWIGLLVVSIGTAFRTWNIMNEDYELFGGHLSQPLSMFISSGLVAAAPAFIVFLWLPLLALGIITFRLSNGVSRLVGALQGQLNEGEEHPLQAIGIVAGAAVLVVSTVLMLLFGVNTELPRKKEGTAAHFVVQPHGVMLPI